MIPMFAYMVFQRMKYLLIVSSNCFERVEAEIAISIVCGIQQNA